jgi:hypothetical protein
MKEITKMCLLLIFTKTPRKIIFNVIRKFLNSTNEKFAIWRTFDSSLSESGKSFEEGKDFFLNLSDYIQEEAVSIQLECV